MGCCRNLKLIDLSCDIAIKQYQFAWKLVHNRKLLFISLKTSVCYMCARSEMNIIYWSIGTKEQVRATVICFQSTYSYTVCEYDCKTSIQKMRNFGMKTGCVASSGCFEDGDKGEQYATDLKQIVIWKGLVEVIKSNLLLQGE